MDVSGKHPLHEEDDPALHPEGYLKMLLSEAIFLYSGRILR